jgi:hypothetical protein
MPRGGEVHARAKCRAPGLDGGEFGPPSVRTRIRQVLGSGLDVDVAVAVAVLAQDAAVPTAGRHASRPRRLVGVADIGTLRAVRRVAPELLHGACAARRGAVARNAWRPGRCTGNVAADCPRAPARWTRGLGGAVVVGGAQDDAPLVQALLRIAGAICIGLAARSP